MRSGFEERVAANLDYHNVAYEYEPYKYAYASKLRMSRCMDCNSTSVWKTRWYTPDFVLDNGIFIEAKGNFKPSNRTAILDILNTCEDINRDNFRMLFMRNNRFGKKGKTYAEWCDDNEIQYAISLNGEVPKKWIT